MLDTSWHLILTIMLVTRLSWDSNSYPSDIVFWLLETELPLSDRAKTPLFIKKLIIMKTKKKIIW
jgi:hypothetical protein